MVAPTLASPQGRAAHRGQDQVRSAGLACSETDLHLQAGLDVGRDGPGGTPRPVMGWGLGDTYGHTLWSSRGLFPLENAVCVKLLIYNCWQLIVVLKAVVHF